MKRLKEKYGTLTTKKLTILAGAVLLVAGLVLQISFDVYAHRNLTQPRDETALSELIIASVNDLHKPAPVDAVTGEVYLPDVRLVLPAPEPSMQVAYANVGDSKTLDLEVITENILHQAEAKLLVAQTSSTTAKRQLDATFAQVPSLQACSRGVQIFNRAQTGYGSQFQLKGTKVLTSGQKLYFYTETTCREDLTPLVNYLMQAQSY